MVNYRTFCISDELFTGFERFIDLDEVESKEEIINKVLEDLRSILNQNNLQVLVGKLGQTRFHIHNFSFSDLLLSKPNTRFYICNHC